MRLGARTKEAIDGVVHMALACERRLIVPAETRHMARMIFEGATKRIEEMGGTPAKERLVWTFPNGSMICVREGA